MDRSAIASGMRSALIASAVVLLGVDALPKGFAASPGAQLGTFALSGGQPGIISELSVHRGKNGTTLQIVQWNRGTVIAIGRYDRNQTQLMHFIIVRDDFREFMHLHPTLNDTTFTVPVALSAGHRYYAYADSRPSGYAHQVFRFTLQGQARHSHQGTALRASQRTILVGPYRVSLPSTRLKPGVQNFVVSILRNGKPANDLTPYLGAAAHAVLIDTANLTYLHVHPMSHAQMQDMSEGSSLVDAADLPADAKVGSRLELFAALPAGVYKLWLQFRGDSTVYTAPFTLVVR